MPGPVLTAEVGDLLVVHFRNADEELGQPVTMHPHGLRYTPDYDGSYVGAYTRPGGFVEPGEEFTYLWEATPDSVGVWPYHDHGPNHMLNTFRGLFGAIVVRERGAKAPDVEQVLALHSLAPPVTGLRSSLQAINGRAYAGNTPTIRARVGQDVALHVMGMDDAWHDFHVHGHRWRDPERRVRRHAERRAQRGHHRPVHGGQPRSLALPLPRLLPPGRRDGRLVRRRCIACSPSWRSSPARTTRARCRPSRRPQPSSSGRVVHVGRGGIQAAVDRARPGDTVRIRRGTYRGRVEIRGASKRGVRLIGDGATIDGAVGVRDTAAVTLRGVTVTRGVVVDHVDRYVLDRLRLRGTGVVVRRSSGGTISRVLVRSAPVGISLADSPAAVRATRTFVRDVTVQGNATGIALDAVRAVTVSRARVLGNATGVAATAVRRESCRTPTSPDRRSASRWRPAATCCSAATACGPTAAM